MSDPCETAESLATATSSCPTADIIIVTTSTAVGTSGTFGGFTQLVTNSAGSNSSVLIDTYPFVTETGNASSALLANVEINPVLVASARAVSQAFAAIDQLAISTADATGSIAEMDTPILLISAAAAVSLALINTEIDLTLVDTARAVSTVRMGMSESVTAAANAVSTVEILRQLDVLATSIGDASATALASNTPQTQLVTALAAAASSVFQQLIAQTQLQDSAAATSGVSFKNPAMRAWIMNTETTAASNYVNFDFESIAQPQGTVLAVGPDGLYELTGSTDAGEQVDAKVVSGFMDFGTAQTKRVDEVFFGYTSVGQLAVTPEVYESGHSPTVFFLEQRAADAPRNSRVVPGKGLWGRYWRMTVQNVNGADFEIHDATVEIAVSTRRL